MSTTTIILSFSSLRGRRTLVCYNICMAPLVGDYTIPYNDNLLVPSWEYSEKQCQWLNSNRPLKLDWLPCVATLGSSSSRQIVIGRIRRPSGANKYTPQHGIRLAT